jgi:hypothetical protein
VKVELKAIDEVRPYEEILGLPGASAVRVFALGPPRNATELEDLDPEGQEAFHRRLAASPGAYFAAAAGADIGHGQPPFAKRYSVPLGEATIDPTHGAFFSSRYGNAPDNPAAEERVPDNVRALNPDLEQQYRAVLFDEDGDPTLAEFGRMASSWTGQDITSDKLIAELSSGEPVLVGMRDPDASQGHLCVIYGATYSQARQPDGLPVGYGLAIALVSQWIRRA